MSDAVFLVAAHTERPYVTIQQLQESSVDSQNRPSSSYLVYVPYLLDVRPSGRTITVPISMSIIAYIPLHC